MGEVWCACADPHRVFHRLGAYHANLARFGVAELFRAIKLGSVLLHRAFGVGPGMVTHSGSVCVWLVLVWVIR